MVYMGRDRKREDPNITPPIPGCPGCGYHFGWHKHGCERRAVQPAAECPHCREVYEIWATTEGFTPVTAPEGYQQQVMTQMRDAAARGLSENREGSR